MNIIDEREYFGLRFIDDSEQSVSDSFCFGRVTHDDSFFFGRVTHDDSFFIEGDSFIMKVIHFYVGWLIINPFFMLVE